ncbi:hypothetical protein TNCV_2958351 [Trichonephila clavipes]|nr:hypothetical protein TNCV_2958351 [Trichonephila clavipes]
MRWLLKVSLLYRVTPLVIHVIVPVNIVSEELERFQVVLVLMECPSDFMRGVLLTENGRIVREVADVDQWRGGEVLGVDIIKKRSEQRSLRTSGLETAYFRGCGLDFNLESYFA